jgi:hypothetical protein
MLTCYLLTIMHQFIVSLHVTKHGFILGLLQNSIGRGSGLFVPIRTQNRRESETGSSKRNTINVMYWRHVSTLSRHRTIKLSVL